jgi:nicotinate-nucleotide adenylyltransferase
VSDAPAGSPITPVPAPAGAPMVILFGGTFDPPHRAHVDLARSAREWLEGKVRMSGRAWLVYMPAARSPLKEHGPVASEEDRVAMVRLAIQGLERSGVWTDEIDRAGPGKAGPSYTIDTVERARRWLDGYGGGKTMLRLLIGADQAVQFHRWKRTREIVEMTEPVVMARSLAGGWVDADGLVEEMARAEFWTGAELAAWRARVAPDAVMDVSSTGVRGAAAGTRRAAESDVAPEVWEYIRAKGLYRSS